LDLTHKDNRLEFKHEVLGCDRVILRAAIQAAVSQRCRRWRFRQLLQLLFCTWLGALIGSLLVGNPWYNTVIAGCVLSFAILTAYLAVRLTRDEY
jgi:hypothetical protein